MKRYIMHIRLLLFMALAVAAFSSCHDDEDDAALYESDGLQSVNYLPQGDVMSVQIFEGEPADVTFRVVPASYASLIASQPLDMLTFVPFSPTNASLEITGLSATDDGLLTVTVTPSSTENGQFYLFALMVRYGDRTVTTDNIKFWREFVPDAKPMVQLKQEQVSQTLAE